MRSLDFEFRRSTWRSVYRKNVLTLIDDRGEWHPDLLWYARAITEMKKRPIADPTSWRYQAAIHDYVRQFDPLAAPSDVLPSTAERQKFWGQCQHFSWFFLSWHRMLPLLLRADCLGHDRAAEWARVGPAVLELQRQQQSRGPTPPAGVSRRAHTRSGAQSPARRPAQSRLQQRPRHRRRVRHRHQRVSRRARVCRTRNGR